MRNIVVVALALALGGCGYTKAVHDGADALGRDLPLFVGNVVPQPSLTPDEAKLPPDQQTRILTDRYNRVRALGEELVRTAKALQEATK